MQSAVRASRGVPQQPFVRAVLTEVAVFEGKRLPAGPDSPVLVDRALAVFGMDELDHRLRLQFLTAEPERLLPRWIQPLEVAAEVSDAQLVDRKSKKAIVQVLGFVSHLVLRSSPPRVSRILLTNLQAIDDLGDAGGLARERHRALTL